MDGLEFSLSLNVNETLGEVAVKSFEAEGGGLDQVWVGDHPDQRYPAIAASLIAMKTERIRIGLGPLSPFLHPATHISAMLTTLVEAYGQRFDLCLVPGDRLKLGSVGVTCRGIPYRMLESLKILRRRFMGEGVKARIWLGAQGPETLRVSGMFDGVLVNLSDPGMIKAVIDGSPVKKYMKDKEFKVGVFFPSYIYRSYDPEVHRIAEGAALRVIYGASKALLKRFNLEGLTVGGASPTNIPREVLERFHLSLPAQRLGEYIKTMGGMGITHFAFAFPQNYKTELIRDLAYAVKSTKRYL
ncbi:MAG: LLM class flavin-dependent oxidoreductase [Candidatus Bathyarchaeia archaeon]|nr:LLM class flavin-dependent oxidoreductase [Candidatus Bathyarchaeota archaeon]